MSIARIDSKAYGMLLAEALPTAIESNPEYERTMAVIEKLHSRGESLSPEEERLLKMLVILAESYEDSISPMRDASPREVLLELMTQHELSEADLVDSFETLSIASEVCFGKREISSAQAEKLAERFKVPADLFL